MGNILFYIPLKFMEVRCNNTIFLNMIGLLHHGLIIHYFVFCICILIFVQKKGSLFVGLSFRQIFPDMAIYRSIYNFESQMLQYQKIYSVLFFFKHDQTTAL